MTETEASSITQVVAFVNEHFKDPRIANFGLFFRGQADYKHALVPTIFRQGREFEGKRIGEADIYHDFRLLRVTQNFRFETIFEWLILMRHYGLPTRLLDWSQSLLVGLHFAVEHPGTDGALFILEPISLNNASDPEKLGEHMCHPQSSQVILRANLTCVSALHAFTVLEEIANLLRNNNKTARIEDGRFSDPWFQRNTETPVAVKPPMQNERIFLQRGVFTIHGGKVAGDKVLIKPTEIEEMNDVDLVKVRIAPEAKDNIRRELEFFGIDEAALFPELDFQSKQILERWTKQM